MKSDVARLPTELAKMPSVSVQLKMDEISIISKLAKTPVTQSVITQAPSVISHSSGQAGARSKSPRPIKKVVVVGSDKPKPQRKIAYAVPSQPGPQVQLPSAPLAMQTPEGLVVYSVASNTPPPKSVSVVQAAPGATTTATTSAGQTIAIGVPTAYLEGSNVYQLLPAASGQQVVYWPPVAAAQTPPAQVTTVATNTPGTGVGGSQLAVVQRGSPTAVVPVAAPTTVLQRAAVAPVAAATTALQPVQQSVDGTAAKGTQKSVITID